mgnify:CR=1 FL=1
MSKAPELNGRYDVPIPLFAQQLITGYTEKNPWLDQSNDIMRAIIMGVALARPNAVSHRGFTVGAVGIGLRQTAANGDHLIRTFHGANDKPEPDGPVNIHAEHEVLDAAEQSGAVLTTLALYGDNQPDDGRGTSFPAIVPCSKVCLPRLQRSLAIDRRRTIFTSLSPTRDTLLLYRLAELEWAYEARSSDGIHRIDLGSPLQLFDAAATQSEEEHTVQPRDETADEAFLFGIVDFTLRHHRERSVI